jgi:hypothetical protein
MARRSRKEKNLDDGYLCLVKITPAYINKTDVFSFRVNSSFSMKI